MTIDMILGLISGLCIFLFGTKLMSKSLVGMTAKRLDRLGSIFGKSKLLAMAAGAGATAAVQSSSAVTALTVSLVDAGAISLLSAAYVIVGSNIGTTFSGIIIAIESFEVSKYLVLLLPAGMLIELIAKGKQKNISWLLIGAGLIFSGLGILSAAAESAVRTEIFRVMFTRSGNMLMMLLIGTFLSAAVQSSTAINGLVILLAGTGEIALCDAAAIILGTNIGTSLSAALSASGMNRAAKQAAVIHIVFNISGSLIFIAVMAAMGRGSCENVLKMLSPKEGFSIAFFNMIQNLITAVLFIPLSVPLVKLSGYIVRDKQSGKKAKNVR